MTASVHTYFDAWNETDAAARRTLLERCLTDDIELVDESGRFRGYEGLTNLIAGFHAKVPGGRVVRSSGIDQFDGIARYAWDILGQDGNTVMVGMDVVELGSDGRLRHIIMFHRPLPALS